MNNEQIQKFITACKNAGFEVDEPESCARGVFRTRIIVADNVCIQHTKYGNDYITFNLHIDGSYEGIKDFKPLIATYLMKALKIHLPAITLHGLANSDKWEVSDIGIQISEAEKFEDAVFEAFCEVYQ